MEAHLLGRYRGLDRDDRIRRDRIRGCRRRSASHHASIGVESLVVVPLVLPTGKLGWMALSAGSADACETGWRRALTEAVARQATMALHYSRLSEQARLENRRQAVLEERNRIARDIHDTLTQGFAAILMQLQAAQRSVPALPPAVVKTLETAVDLARTHMIEARRSVGALRPHTAEGEHVAAALAAPDGSHAAHHRSADRSDDR